MSQKGYIHLYGNCLYSKVKFPVDRSSYNARSTIFLIVFNLLIVILSSFCRWIQALISLLPIKLPAQTCCSQQNLITYFPCDFKPHPRDVPVLKNEGKTNVELSSIYLGIWPRYIGNPQTNGR